MVLVLGRVSMARLVLAGLREIFQLIEREFLVDKSKGDLLRFRLIIDEIDNPNSFRFKAFCARKIRTQF